MKFNTYTSAGAAFLDSVVRPQATGPAKIDTLEAEQRIVDSAAEFADADISASAAAVVQDWASTEDLDDGEGMADRLIAMLVGVADEDGAGELGDDEAEVASMAADSAWDYMAGKGASDEDLGAIFGDDPDEANAAAMRVAELLNDSMPDGDEAAMDDVNNHAFRWAASGNVLDAVYKKRMAVRGGRKQIIMKRVSGMVHRSAAQKLAVRKASMKAHGSAAKMHRAKSMRVRKSMGLGKR